MIFTTATLFVLFMSTNQVRAVCPGFSFAIGNVIHQDGDFNRWNVYDSNCNVVDGLRLKTKENPCIQGIFGCTPDPIAFDTYTSTTTGVQYLCRRDPNTETCTTDTISVCCAATASLSTSSTISQTHFFTAPTAPSVTGNATSTLSPSSRSSNTSGGGLSSGAIAGIAVAAVLVLLAVIGTLLYCKTRRGHGKGMVFSAGQEPGGMRQPPRPLDGVMHLPFASPISRPISSHRWDDGRTASTISSSVWTYGKAESPTSDRTSTLSEIVPPPYNPEWEDLSDRSSGKLGYQYS